MLVFCLLSSLRLVSWLMIFHPRYFCSQTQSRGQAVRQQILAPSILQYLRIIPYQVSIGTLKVLHSKQCCQQFCSKLGNLVGKAKNLWLTFQFRITLNSIIQYYNLQYCISFNFQLPFQHMKANHKRIPSGIQNSSLLQNTQRINQPKKNIQEKETARKMKPSEQDFYKVLNETQTLELYNMMTDFQAQVQQSLNEGNLQSMADCCVNFKQKISNFCLQYHNEQIATHKQDESQKIKQLLQEIYMLRKKVADLDGSLILDSISSLQENYAKTAEQYQIKQPQNNMQNENDTIILSESIVNFMQLKQMTYQLLSIIWRYTSFHFEDQSTILLQNLKVAYKYQFELSCSPYDPKSASLSMDKISSLIAIAHNCVSKLKVQNINSSTQANIISCA